MFNFVSRLFGGNNAKYLADLFGVIFGAIGNSIKNKILNIFGVIWNLITKYIWFICKWILAILDALQLAFTRLLGLYTSTGAEMTAEDYIEGMKEITVSGGSTYYDYIMKIFKAVAVVAIILMIIFTIFSMIMQDYKLAVDGYNGKAENSKGKFIKIILSNIVTICLIPLIFYTIIVGVNSILTSFYRSLGNYSDTTIAGNVLAASTYDANRYRAYANAGRRIPITISVYSTENAFGKELSNSELEDEIKSDEVQEKLKAIGGAFANNSFLPFEKSTIYVNGNWESYANYSLTYNNNIYDDMGQYFENFICTREQYYVLADFIDYCQLYNINYYIKEISEPDICWKYVSSLSANSEVDEDGNAYGDITLTINYKNAETINNPTATASAASSSSLGDTYSLKLTTKLDLTSPVSDALKTASKLLGLNDETSSFYTMERDDSGDYSNLIEWSTEKVILKLSEHFELDRPSTWTFSDQIIVYEYYRYQNSFNSTNNALEDYTIDQLKETGAKLDVLKLNYRNFNTNTLTYTEEHELLCTKINSNYYRVRESEDYTDDYGNPYYVLDVLDENVNYFTDVVVGIENTTSVATRLSSGFDINDSSKWKFTDQVLVYEYFSNGNISSSLDGQISNGNSSIIDFTLLNHDSSSDFKFNVYKITTSKASTGATTETKYYLKINNTLYECNNEGKLHDEGGNVADDDDNFLVDANNKLKMWYGYKLGKTEQSKYGIDNLTGLIKTSISNETELDNSDAFYQKYSGINRKLSEDFSVYNTQTWTFKDYALMKLYVSKLSSDIYTTIDSLSVFGVKGDIVKGEVDGKEGYYVKIIQTVQNAAATTTSQRTIYLDIEAFSKISELNITSTLAAEEIYNALKFDQNYNNLVKKYNSNDDFLLDSKISTETFYMSEGFDAYTPSTWSIGDYILMYVLGFENVDTDSETISYKPQKGLGYGAMVYNIGGQEYYRFGKAVASASENDNILFISKTSIENLGYTPKKFFNTNLMAFLLNDYYDGLDFSSIYKTKENFELNEVVDNPDKYILNIDSNYSNNTNLQYILASEFIKNNTDNIINLSNTDILNYSYYNPNINADDLSTWNNLDTVIYLKTGVLPTAEDPYSSTVFYISAGANEGYYMLVDDVYVKVTDTLYSNSGKPFSTEIKSTTPTEEFEAYLNTEIYPDGIAENYYTEHFEEKFGSLVLTDSTKIRQMTSNGKFYYYSSLLKGNSGETAAFISDKIMSNFDIVLAKYEVNLTENGYYTFDAFTLVDGDTKSTYIKILGKSGDIYLKIGNSDATLIYYKENSLVAKNGSILFTANGTYNAFTGTDYNSKINKFDALFYSVTGSNEQKEYKIYKIGTDSYILVDGKIMKYDSGLASEDFNLSINPFSSEEKALEYANSLYEEYYQNFVLYSTPQFTDEKSIEATNYVHFDADDISTWNGLSIILRFIDSDEEESEDEETGAEDEGSGGETGEGTEGEGAGGETGEGEGAGTEGATATNNGVNFSDAETRKKITYLVYSYTENGETKTRNYLKLQTGSVTKYIKLDEISTISWSTEPKNTLNFLYEDFRNIMLLKLANIETKVEDETTIYLGKEAEYFELSSSTLISDGVSNKFDISSLRKNCYENSAGTTTEEWLKNWTWLGLLSLYRNSDSAMEIQAYYYAGQNYILIKNSGTIYELIPESLLGSYVSGGFSAEKIEDYFTISSYTYDATSVTVLNKVIESENFNTEGILKFEKTGGTSFYLVEKDDNYSAIYNLPGADSTEITKEMEYLTYNSASADKIVGTTSLTDAKRLSFVVKAIDGNSDNNWSSWNILDFILSYKFSNVNSLGIESLIYVQGGNYYISYSDYYILIPLADGGGISSILSYSDTSGKFSLSSSNPTLLNMLFANSYDYLDKENNEIQTGFLEKFNSADVEDEATLSSMLYSYEENLYKKDATSGKYEVDSNGDLVKVLGDGKLQRVDFSANFDISDYSTWTYSDFIIYYAFTNKMFGKGTEDSNEISFEFPFVYVPTWTKSGDKFYNLTYFDIILADFYGKETPTSGSYKYFSNQQASYDLSLCYNSTGYYLKLSDEYFVRLSDNIILDFTTMKVNPVLLGENLTTSEIDSRLVTTPAESVKGTEAATIKNSVDLEVYKTVFDCTNFQTFANAHGAPAYAYYLVNQNSDTGDTESNYILKFAAENTRSNNEKCFIYDTFYAFYGKDLKNYVKTNEEVTLKITTETGTDAPAGQDFSISIEYQNDFPALKFKNYYYFAVEISSGDTNLKKINTFDIDDEKAKEIKNDIANNKFSKALINLKLSSGFSITDVSKWTVLDYILVSEFANEKVNSNFFKGMEFSELKDDYIKNIAYVNGRNVYLYLNNNFYNITEFVGLDDSDASNQYYVGKDTKMNSDGTTDVVSPATISGRSFRVLTETKSFNINPLYNRSTEYSRDANNISYDIGNVQYYRYIDTDVSETNYRIKVSNFATYTTQKYIKTVSWVEKLMTDMQVYYPDLNWGILIATDGWLDTLGEFTSAYTNGLYVTGENSSNTTAAGLVLSEFFLSKATAVSDSYADYEYSSMFNQDTVDALMRSIMGEENYQALTLEMEVFMDFFNSCFAPIIDDFADEFGESVSDNSLRLNAYKSYLATLLLSSDIGEYLYTIATRVYAEYTIGEYLAKAGDDYGGYYAYVNNLNDQDGNVVDSFSYGTFIELIKYENEYCGKNNPTFTFNFKQAFDKYKGEDGKIGNYSYDEAMNNESIYSLVAQVLINNIDANYETIYKKGYMVGENGKVIDKYGEEVLAYSGDIYNYCYMIHVYWEIKTDVKNSDPSYLELYRKYLMGDIDRWSILCDDEIETADQYFENYNSDKTKRVLYRNLTSFSALSLYFPRTSFSGNIFEILLANAGASLDMFNLLISAIGDLVTTGGFGDNTKTALGNYLQNGVIPVFNALDICSNNTSLSNDVKNVVTSSFMLNIIMSASEDDSFSVTALVEKVLEAFGWSSAFGSKEENWNKLLSYQTSVDNILKELKDVSKLLPGQKTAKGCSREIIDTGVYYTDDQLDQIINTFSTLSLNLTNYIELQTRLDKAQKKSITFTLAQYGSNYVSTGYEFSVKNKSYKFNSNIDPVRLAEYVYGGAFLEEVGVGAQYTSAEFEGIVTSKKVYDKADGIMKTQLNSWPELRGFASEIAKESAELYFTTNLIDLDISKKNELKLTDKINITNNSGVGETSGITSVEEMLYFYIISGINEDIVSRITGSDGSDGNTNKDYTHAKFVSMCKYIFSGDMDDNALENATLEDFKRIVIQKLIDNDQNEEETPDERAGRYLTLYNLLSVQVEYQTTDTNSDIGRIIAKGNITRNGDIITYLQNVSNYGASAANEVVNYDVAAVPSATNIQAIFTTSSNTLEVIKKISGLENRPTREVLTREYSGIRTGDYFDEAFGDSFIACTYKNGMYYPIIGTGSRSYTDAQYAEYLEKGFLNHKFISDYYDNTANVVVMKGIITADGYPTAIRKYNNPVEVLQKKLFSSSTEVYNSITYYRTNVGATFGEGNNLVDASRVVGRVTTRNYTKYESNTSFTKGVGSAELMTGKTNLKTVVSSDYSAWFAQSKVEYLISQADDLGAISVLDEFSYFYVFGGQTWVLLMLAFVTLIPFMVNAIGGAISRIFNLIILFLISPLVISTNSLYTEGKNETFQKWKKGLQVNSLTAFGYIIGFSSFAILVPMINNVTSFVSVSTYNKVIAIGGLGGFFSYPTVNSLVKCLWIITAVSVLEKVPALLLPIISENGNITSPHPGVIESGDDKKFTTKANSVIGDVKEMAGKISSIVSGKAALGMIKTAKDDLVSMIPGSTIGKDIKEKIFDPRASQKKADKIEAEGKEIEEMLEKYGIDHNTAAAAGNALKKEQKMKENQKKAKKQKWNAYKQSFDNLT